MPYKKSIIFASVNMNMEEYPMDDSKVGYIFHYQQVLSLFANCNLHKKWILTHLRGKKYP